MDSCNGQSPEIPSITLSSAPCDIPCDTSCDTSCDTPCEEAHVEKPGKMMVIVKSTWFTVMLASYLCAGAVVFMGIEGNHQELLGYQQYDRKQEFRLKVEQWLLSNKPRAVALRENIGLDVNLPPETFIAVVEKQVTKNMSVFEKITNLNCSFAKYKLSSWNDKSYGDSFTYATSILSTVGWGVYYPPSAKLKLITLIYMFPGLVLFMGLIRVIVGRLEVFEVYFKERRWVKYYLGDENLILGLQLIVVFFIMWLYGFMCDGLVEQEYDSTLAAMLIDTGEDYSWSFLISFYYTIQTVTTIGFGDVYIYSPIHSSGDFGSILLRLSPVLSTIVTVFVIALFVRVFRKMRAHVEEKAEKKTRRAEKTMVAVKTGVLKASSMLSVEIQDGVNINKTGN